MFITFEGGEGTGKTTLIKNITDALVKKYDVVTTREPGGSMVAEAIRDVVLNPKYLGVTIYTEALLYAASRAQHLDEIVIPALNSGKLVLCDRYLDSSLAYQGFGRKLGVEFVLSINRHALDYLPDLTFYIDLDPAIGLERISKRSKKDRLDQENLDFHKIVRDGYLEVAKMYPNRILVIDGNKSISELTEIILKRIEERL